MAAATTILAGASLAVGAGSAIASADAQRKARNQAADAAKAGQVDINALDEQTRAVAQRNAAESAALEKRLTPEVPLLRTAANQAVLNNIGGSPGQNALSGFLMSRFGQPTTNAQFNRTQLGELPTLNHTADFQKTQLGDTPDFQRTNLEATPTLAAPNIQTPLLAEAIAKARSDLALGGKLSVEQRNEATRRGAAQAGRVSGGLGLGRDLSARDLGLTSYGVEQQRLQNASAIGGQEMSLQQLIQNSLLNNANFNLNKNLGEANFGLNQNLGEANYGLNRALGIGNFNAGQNANEANFNLSRNLGEANYGLNSALGQANFNAGQNLNEANFNLNRDSINAQNYLSQFGALSSYYNNLRQQDLAAAAYGQSIAPPQVGLDPSAYGNLSVGNSNNAAAAAQNRAAITAQQGQNWMNFGGQLLGYGLNNFSGGASNSGAYNPSTLSNSGFGGT